MKKRNSKKTKKTFSLVFLLIVSFFVLITSFAGGYLLANYFADKKIEYLKLKIDSLEKSNASLLDEIKKEASNTKTYYLPSETQDLKSSGGDKDLGLHEQKSLKTNKPKLVIILDDVAFGYEVREIETIPYHITMSFFPPSSTHPDTYKYARNFAPHYMVHLPTQAMNHNFKEEADTLHVGDSYKKIENRIRFIKKYFPDLKYVNNHTGSKFTANKKEMEYLYRALFKYHIRFVDSVTTSHTKAKIVAQEYGLPYFRRNIFLDNKQNVSYIRNQLKKAVRIAKLKGYAIAIGHPHKATIKALKESGDILKNVDVIYMDQLGKILYPNTEF